MSYLVGVAFTDRNFREIEQAFAKYKDYLDSIKQSLPPAAYGFASAPWHYNPHDHRCPHDSWVESVVVREKSSGSRHEIRNIELAVRLLGAYHDGHLELSYISVVSYSFSSKQDSSGSNKGHGDWLVDEVRLSESNLVLHEIIFSSGSRWLIECQDIESAWIPLSSPAS